MTQPGRIASTMTSGDRPGPPSRRGTWPCRRRRAPNRTCWNGVIRRRWPRPRRPRASWS